MARIPVKPKRPPSNPRPGQPPLSDKTSVLRKQRDQVLLKELAKTSGFARKPFRLLERDTLPASKLSGLNPGLQKTLAAAGFVQRSQLPYFCIADLGAKASELSLDEVTQLHQEKIAAEYAGLGLTRNQVSLLARSGIRPKFLGRYFRLCGRRYDFVHRDQALRDALLEIPLEKWQTLEPKVLERWYRNGKPPLAGHWASGGLRSSLAALRERAEPLRSHELQGLQADRRRAEALLAQTAQEDTVADLLLQAQLHAFDGDEEMALQLASHAASAKLADDGLAAYQARVVAPAVIASLKKQQPRLRLATAASILEHAEPGSQVMHRAIEVAMQEASELARQGLHQDRRAGTEYFASQGARRALIESLGAGQLPESVRAASTIPMQSSLCLLDYARAYSAALVEGGKPGYVDDARDPGSQKVLRGERSYMDLLGDAGLASALADAGMRAEVFDTLGRLRRTPLKSCAEQGLLGALQGDLFRVDFLLGEVRRLVEDIGRIEALLFSLIDTLVSQGLAIAEQIQGVLNQLLDTLTEMIEQISEQIFAVIDELIPKLIEVAVIGAMLELLRNLPHDNWRALFVRTRDHVNNDMPLVDAMLQAMREMLAADISGMLANVAGTVETRLAALTEQIRDALLPEDLRSRLSELLGGSTADADQLLDTLTGAVARFDLVARAQDRLDALRNVAAGTIPGWVAALMLSYVILPLTAALSVVIVPIILVLAMGAPWLLLVLGLVVAGKLSLAAAGKLAIAAVLTFVIVAGLQYLLALVLRALTGSQSLLAQLNALVEASMDKLKALVDRLLTQLADVGKLHSLLDIAQHTLDEMTELLDDVVADRLYKVLCGARDILLDSTRALLCPLERSFFRETLELVNISPGLLAPVLPNNTEIVGQQDRQLGATGPLAAALAKVERTRVERGLAAPLALTQMLSLRQLLALTQPVQLEGIPLLQQLQGLLDGDQLLFSITGNLLDTLEPGLHRARIKDVQVLVDFDLDAPGFNLAPAAAVLLAELADSLLLDLPELDGSQTLGSLVDGNLLADLLVDLGGLLQGELPNLSEQEASAVAAILAQGMQVLEIAPEDASSASQTLAQVLGAGLDSENMLWLEFITGTPLAVVLLDALEQAGLDMQASRLPLLQVLEAGLRTLAQRPQGLSSLNGATVIERGYAALSPEQAGAQMMELARQLAGGVADPALDGRFPGGGFPGLPVVAGRLPSGLPLVMQHDGLSRVRMKPSESLRNAYRDHCGRPLDNDCLPCALKNTRLLNDDDNPLAQAAGWRWLEFNDPPLAQLFSHLDILRDGVRFITTDKQVKPMEYRGLVGNWSLQIPALANGSVKVKLPPIRDVRLAVSLTGNFDPELRQLVSQPQAPALPDALTPTLPLPPLPALPGADAAEEFSSISGSLDDLLGDLNGALSGASDTLGGVLGIAGSALQQGTGEVTGALGLNQLLARQSRSVARMTSARTQLLSFTESSLTALPSGTRRNGHWTISEADLRAQGIEPSQVRRLLAVTVAPVTESALLSVNLPTAPGSLNGPGQGSDALDLAVQFKNGAASVPIPPVAGVLRPEGRWALQLPAGMPKLSGMAISYYLEMVD